MVIHNSNGLDVLRALAVACVAVHSRLRPREAAFVRAVAAGRPLTRATALPFHRIASRLRDGGGA